jgi:hypothetical protein
LLCQDCPKRGECIELCEQSEGFVNQDHETLKEKTVPTLHFKKKKFVSLHQNLDVDVEWGWVDGEFQTKVIPRKPVHLTANDRRLIKYIAMGLSREEICEVMEITKKTYRQYLWRLKKKAKEL